MNNAPSIAELKRWRDTIQLSTEALGMNPLKNLQVNLLAHGGWAIVGILVICITVLGVLGDGVMAERAMTALIVTTGLVAAAMAARPYG